mgnify:FL=1
MKKEALMAWCIGLCSLLPAPTRAEETPDNGERVYWLPGQVDEVKKPVLLLNGEWDFKYDNKSRWTDIQVPGEPAMQGYAIRHDQPFWYRHTFTVPRDFAGKRIILRFDGVYCHARLTINGQFVREHWGGFTRWETDVTRYVKPGRKNEIRLEVEDRIDDPSYAAGYAHHPIGGILRDVTLIALPESSICDVSVETDLDSLYRDADLRLDCHLDGEDNGTALQLRLTAPDGKTVALKQDRFALTEGANHLSIPVRNPLKWDAEHPHLYTLEVRLTKDGRETARFSRQVGFREVEIVKNRMLVNGRPVKLRGACRHDIHPTLGRTTSAELDSLDAVLFKEANMNFVRTSHYPPSERFLQYCDRYGIYVECETAVCFVDTYRQKNYAPGNSQSDPAFAHRYLGQCQEMVKAFRPHPSVLFWSVGNESVYGTNFQLTHDWVKQTDKTRPVIFSYPGSVEKGKEMYEILSMHYQDVHGNLWQWNKQTSGFQTPDGIPALFDEWAHPACYTYATLRTDPNIREFWGKSLDMMWSGLYDAPGGLGGAIWGYVDETFALPEPKRGTAFWKEFAHTAKPEGFRGNCVGYGEWGIVDVWRRKKPEFWATKKAYSPVRLLAGREISYTPGQPIRLDVHNRFDHTDLSELTVRYSYKGQERQASLTAAAPHGKGTLTLPASAWEEGEDVIISYYTADGQCVDTDRVTLGREKIALPAPAEGTRLTVTEEAGRTVVRGEGFEIPFDKATGLITDARIGGETWIEKGPFLNAYINLNHLSGAEVRKIANHIEVSEADWQKTGFELRKEKEAVHVTLKGTYRDVKATFDIHITPRGEMSVSYDTEGLPNGYLREAGLTFRLSQAPATLDWQRRGYWNHYPEGELGANRGKADLYNSHVPAYGENPDQPWVMDTHNYYYWSDRGSGSAHPLTQLAKGMKENIYWYTLRSANGKSLSIVSPDASVACRMDKTADDVLMLHTNNRWDYPEIAWGNYCKTLEALPFHGEIRFLLK